MGSRVTNRYENASSYTGPSKRRVSTAHIQPGFDINGTLAYDQFVSTCSDFLGSPTINETVTQFAENILAILSSPVTLEASEVKRRIEQILPTDKNLKHHRGTKMTDKDCTLLCSLADRIVNIIPFQQPNLNIVDHQEQQDEKDSYNSGSVHYIRHRDENRDIPFPQQLPNFVEPNTELGENNNVAYDFDVTPYDSEVDEPAQIRM